MTHIKRDRKRLHNCVLQLSLQKLEPAVSSTGLRAYFHSFCIDRDLAMRNCSLGSDWISRSILVRSSPASPLDCAQLITQLDAIRFCTSVSCTNVALEVYRETMAWVGFDPSRRCCSEGVLVRRVSSVAIFLRRYSSLSFLLKRKSDLRVRRFRGGNGRSNLI